MEISKNNLSFIAFVLGIFAGLILIIMATWGDLEASFYGFDRVGGLRLSSLSCPILMNESETSSFTFKIKNSTDRNLSPSVKTDISTGITPISTYKNILLTPGETKKLEYALTPENIDLGGFIFARVWIYASYPLPDRESTCGVLILPLPIRGSSITLALFVLSLLGIGIGFYLQKQAGGPARSGLQFQRYILLTSFILVGLLSAYFGIWLLGVVTVALSLLVSIVSIAHSVKI